MTASTTTQPRKQTARPTVWRLLASKYVDLLICGFTAWVLCFTFGWQNYWTTLALFLWIAGLIWCRDRLKPTAGEYCLGIRYLTSSSSQVVADIQVIHNKLKLNGFLVAAGVGELSLAIFLFCGWTFLSKASTCGFDFGQPLSLAYWMFSGLVFFLCSGYLLSGSKHALWFAPLSHIALLVDLFLSDPKWHDILRKNLLSPSWMTEPLTFLGKSPNYFLFEIFLFWSLFVGTVIIFSRKHLVN